MMPIIYFKRFQKKYKYGKSFNNCKISVRGVWVSICGILYTFQYVLYF